MKTRGLGGSGGKGSHVMLHPRPTTHSIEASIHVCFCPPGTHVSFPHTTMRPHSHGAPQGSLAPALGFLSVPFQGHRLQVNEGPAPALFLQNTDQLWPCGAQSTEGSYSPPDPQPCSKTDYHFWS